VHSLARRIALPGMIPPDRNTGRSHCNRRGGDDEICVSPIAGRVRRHLLDLHLGRVRLSSGFCRAVWRRASGALLGLVGAIAMQKISSVVRVAICASAIAAFSMTMLIPTPASAWWYHRGWGWHSGWHYGWRGCCWGPPVVFGVVPPVVAVPPPVVYAPPPVGPGRVWIPPHWNGPYWVPGHWG